MDLLVKLAIVALELYRFPPVLQAVVVVRRWPLRSKVAELGRVHPVVLDCGGRTQFDRPAAQVKGIPAANAVNRHCGPSRPGFGFCARHVASSVAPSILWSRCKSWKTSWAR